MTWDWAETETPRSLVLIWFFIQAQLKKMTKLWQQEVRKEEARAKKAKEDAEAQIKRAEEAKKVVIKLDTSLPTPVKYVIGLVSDNGCRI